MNYNQQSMLKMQKIIPIIASQVIKNETSITVSNKNIVFALNVLKNHVNYQYNLLSCISGVDLLHTTHRFSVVYDLLSLKFNSRIRVKIFLNETTSVASSISVYVNANWWEREVWDLFGIYFKNHPDLRRILTDYGFEGHPLRKDFPLFGFMETGYEAGAKRVGLRPVELTQEHRTFGSTYSW